MKKTMTGIKLERVALGMALACLYGCAGAEITERASTPIENPFGNGFSSGSASSSNSPIVLRTRQGEKSFEVEIPDGDQNAISNFIVPMNPNLSSGGGRSPASDGSFQSIDKDYSGIRPTQADREILATLPKGAPQENWKRDEIEASLGLVPQEESTPQADSSYLAGLDQIKRLYREKRFEVALIELDSMVTKYPTSPKLFEMRGTVLDRLGYADLAMKSWKQALEFNPNNLSLKKFIERRAQMQTRRLASP